jgi:hypothetical protein
MPGNADAPPEGEDEDAEAAHGLGEEHAIGFAQVGLAIMPDRASVVAKTPWVVQLHAVGQEYLACPLAETVQTLGLPVRQFGIASSLDKSTDLASDGHNAGRVPCMETSVAVLRGSKAQGEYGGWGWVLHGLPF